MFLKILKIPPILRDMKKQSLVLYLLLLLLPLGSLAQVTFTAESLNINCESNNFSIDVSVDNFTDMNAFQYSMHWDPAIIQYTSTSNNNFGNSIGTTNASNGTLQISWFSQTSGTNIPDGSTIFTLNFDLIGSAASALINFDGNPTPIIIAQGGSQLPSSDYAFVNGNINFEDNTAPTASCPANITVDAMGASSIQVASISPSGTDNCGIESYSYTLSGANNGSGVGDVSNSVNFNVGTTTVTYQASDFGGNTETCSFDVTIENNNPITGFHLIGEAETVNCTDNLVSVDILANNFIDLKGVQFTLNWNSTALQYIDTSNVVFTNGASFGTMNASNGVLTFSWFNSTPTTLPNGQVLFTINYMVDAPVGATIPIPFINAPTPIQFVDSNNMALAPADYTITNGSVTIVDTQDPTIACPQDVNVNSTNGTDAIVNNIAPTANDECGIASLTYTLSGATTGTGTDDASGTTFNVGTTAVTYTVTDDGGNTATCNFNVTVTTTPVETITISIDSLDIDCSSNTVELCISPENFDDIRGIQFTINWDATALQYIDTSEINLTNALYGINDVGNGVLTYSWFSANAPVSLSDGTSLFCINFDLINAAPGDSYDITFANFPTPVQLATQTSLPGFVPTSDYVISNGNIVINADTEAPTLDCPSDVNENSGGASTLVVNNIAPTTSDNCSTPTVTYEVTGATTVTGGTDDASGTAFNVGTSTVTYTSTDASGNSISCSFEVVVVQEMLSITCPTNVLVPSDFNTCTAMINNLALTINSSMANVASVTYTISENPIVTGTGGVINHTFELGTSLVTFEVTDIFGNSTSCAFNVTVTDAEVPVFSGCPLDITVSSAADCSAAVNWTPPTATDNCDTDITIESSHDSGDTFLGGTTTVTYTATDDFNNSTTCSFDVTVADNIPPAFLCPSDVTVNIGGTTIDQNNFIADAMMMGCDSVVIDYNTPLGSDNCPSFSITSDTPDSTTYGAGLHTIVFTITDMAGNTATCEVNVTVVAQNSFSIAATPDTVCVGGTVNLQTIPASTTATYSWVGPNGFTSNLANPILTDFMLTDTGMYTVTINDPNACVTSTVLSVTVSALDSPAVTIVSDPETLECIDGPQEVTLSGSTMDNVTAWEWIDPNGISVGSDPNLIITVDPNSTGTYTLLATGENGCITTVMYPIMVSNSIETPAITSTCNGGICVGDNCTFFGMFAGSVDSVLWESNSPNLGLPAVTNTNSIMITPTAGGANSLTFTIFKDGCSATATIAVPVSFPALVAPDEVAVSLDTPITFSVIDNDSVPPGFAIAPVVGLTNGGTLINNLDGTFSYTPPSGFLGTDMFIYEICTLCDGGPICRTGTVTLNVTTTGCLIPTIITPNGDGMNDEWQISCAINNPQNELTVYNRWGDQVYEAAPYLGDWKGTYNNEDLPDGTYYFIYKNSASDTDPEKGYLTIMR